MLQHYIDKMNEITVYFIVGCIIMSVVAIAIYRAIKSSKDPISRDDEIAQIRETTTIEERARLIAEAMESGDEVEIEWAKTEIQSLPEPKRTELNEKYLDKCES